MNPFMLQVQSVRSGDVQPDGPVLVATRTRSVAAGTDRHLAVRSLAEQLVAEANSVLGADQLALTDHPGLAFTLAYGDQCAEITTSMDGRTAIARLDGTDLELVDEGAVADLLLRLLAG